MTFLVFQYLYILWNCHRIFEWYKCLLCQNPNEKYGSYLSFVPHLTHTIQFHPLLGFRLKQEIVSGSGGGAVSKRI